MTQSEYERHVSREMGISVKRLADMGYHSFPEREERDGPGWAHVAIPPNGEGEIVILGICRRGVGRGEISAFGESRNG